MQKFLLSLIIYFSVINVSHSATVVYNFIDQQSAGQNSLIFEVSDVIEYKTFTLKNPDRLVIDIKNTLWKAGDKPVTNLNLYQKIRHGIKDKTDLRIVVDLAQPIIIAKQALFDIKDNNKYRLLIDIKPKSSAPTNQPKIVTPKNLITDPLNKAAPQNIVSDLTISKANPSFHTPVVVIDPGHGGEDPGTIGKAHNSYEKNITLAYAKALKEHLEQKQHYKVILTRNNDSFITLKDRLYKAKDAKADIFISLHADSHADPQMRGMSIYTLSDQASDQEAEILSSQTDKNNIITGLNLTDESNDVASALIDLARRNSKNTSIEFASLVVSEVGKDVKVLKNAHRAAGFKVLKGTDMPAVLIELGYLSNSKEEELLNSPEHEAKITLALANAIERHFKRKIPVNNTVKIKQ